MQLTLTKAENSNIVFVSEILKRMQIATQKVANHGGELQATLTLDAKTNHKLVVENIDGSLRLDLSFSGVLIGTYLVSTETGETKVTYLFSKESFRLKNGGIFRIMQQLAGA